MSNSDKSTLSPKAESSWYDEDGRPILIGELDAEGIRALIEHRMTITRAYVDKQQQQRDQFISNLRVINANNRRRRRKQ